jgi:hypothetical protein
MRAFATTAFPVIERELRQQARRPAGAWVRVIAALFASIAVLTVLGSTNNSRIGGVMPGQAVFLTLSVIIFVFCLFEGVRQTADSLAREKREGTLGLLFLTDLRGLDVVLGKLAANSVGSGYALLAVFPAMSVALPFGGVTVGEFWRTQLVLLETLFLGLAVGLWASACERQTGRALLRGMAMVIGLAVVPMMFDFLLARGSLPNLSPAMALQLAGDRAYRTDPLRFWLTLLTVFAVAWTYLILASRHLLRSWHDEEQPATVKALLAPPPDDGQRWAPEGEPVWTEDFATYRRAGPAIERPERALIEHNPAVWLAAWVPSHRFLAATAVYLLALGAFSGNLFGVFLGASLFGAMHTGIAWLTGIIPLLLLAYVASRPLAEARASGALELLLSTPLPVAEIVRAHWMSLWRQMRAPVYVSAVIISIVLLFAVSAALTAPSSSGERLGFLVLQLLSCASRVVTGLAVCRVALYFGLKTFSPFAAVAQTILYCVIAVWVFTLIQGVLFSPLYSLFGFVAFQFAQLFTTSLGVLYCLWLIRWTNRQLLLRFRELATKTGTGEVGLNSLVRATP